MLNVSPYYQLNVPVSQCTWMHARISDTHARNTTKHNTTQHDITQRNAKSITKIVPVSSIAPEGWGPKEGGNAMSPLHSRGSPNNGGQNENWLPQPYLLGGPKRGRKCYITPASTLPSRGPKRGRKCYITPAFSGVPKQWGTKSELAASHLPSQGPERGRKCYVTPAFLGVPNKGDKIRYLR